LLITLITGFFLAGSLELRAQFKTPDRERGCLAFSLENDVWLKQDEGYTNGIQLMWISPVLSGESGPFFMKYLYKLNLKFLGPEDVSPAEEAKIRKDERRAALSLAQGMFTPDSLTEKELIPDDRPYAGLLYASLGLIRMNQKKQDSIGLAAGVVGPLSLAGTVQRWLHKTYGWTYPEGWEHQLKNEPVLQLWFNRLWTLVSPGKFSPGFQPVIKAGVGGRAGNLMTAAEAIVDFKLGFNLEPRMDAFTASPLFGQLLTGRASRTSVQAFVRLEGRILARNLLLEGNTFQSSHGVDIQHLYGQVSAGLAYQTDLAGFLCHVVVRTREFKGQKYRNPYFGLTISLKL
jgi:hypothetical protein